MTKHPLQLMLLALILASCDKVTVDFSYSPSEPKAGEKVTFLNASSKGDDWLWRFGDRGASTSKNPSHTYNEPGTYQVILQVDGNEKNTCTHMITIVDSIPTFVGDHDSLAIGVFEDVTFSVKAFNPNDEQIIYHWFAQPDCAVVADSTGGTWKVYFTTTGQVDITMDITLSGKTTTVTRSYTVEDRKAPSLLMLDSDSKMLRQRIFYTLNRAEEVTSLTYAEGKTILNGMQDTLQTVNGHEYRLSDLQFILPEMSGFRVAYGKVYFRTTSGLYISDVTGNNINVIDEQPVSAVYTDTYTGANRLYWVTSSGVYYMPLVDHPMNRFDPAKISLLNEQSNIVRIAMDTTYRLR